MKWMDLALIFAKQAYKRDEVPVGAVLVQDNKIIAQNHNRMKELNNPTAHAEWLVVEEGLKILKTPYLQDCTLYVTLEPCVFCAAALSTVRIKEIFYGAYDVKMGAIDHGPCLYHFTHHKPQVVGGVQENKCAQLLKNFFLDKR